MSGKDERRCVDCGIVTDLWVLGWDARYRCMDHAARGPSPDALADYLLDAGEGHLEFVHERCGASLLVGLRAHLDDLTQLVREHECRPIPPEVAP